LWRWRDTASRVFLVIANYSFTSLVSFSKSYKIISFWISNY
jgi:hypothetical protein